MGIRPLQASFTGGELSPSLYGRVDVARYGTSLRTCRNFIVRPMGGVTNRPGTQFVCYVKDSTAKVRLMPFVVSTAAAYIIEVGDQYIRFVSNGAQVLNGPPVEVATPWLDADIGGLHFTQSADVMTVVHQKYAPQEIRRLSSISFALNEFLPRGGPFQDTNPSPSGTVRASSANGLSTITASSAIFTAAMVGSLFYIEARDQRAIPPWEASKRLAVGGGSPTNPFGLLRRSDGKVYRCVTNQACTGTNEIRTGTVRPTHDEGIEADGDGSSTGATIDRAGVQWEFQNAGFGVVRIATFTNSTTVIGEVLIRLPDSVVGAQGATANTFNLVGDGATKTFAAAGITQNDVFQYIVTVGGVLINPGEPPAGKYGYLVDAAADTIYITPVVPNGIAIAVLEITASGDHRTDRWALSAWSSTQGYPREVEYYGDRLIFAGSTLQPQTVWASKTGNYSDFGHSTPLVDDDALTFTINARNLNAIRDLVALNNLVLLTSGGEWKVTAGVNDIISPSTVGFKPQTFWGSSELAAVVVGKSAIYVQDRGYAIRDLIFDLYTDGYTGTELSIFASHLVEGHQIVDIAYQQIPFQVVWLLRDDGVLLSLTYVREQDVIGWARHDTDGLVESIAVIPEGGEDALYMVVKRTLPGGVKRCIERLSTRLFSSPLDYFFVDCGLSYDGRNSLLTGAVITISGGTNWTEDETLTMTAGASVFNGTQDIGDIVDFNDGTNRVRMKITAYIDHNHVSASPIGTVPVAFRGVATLYWSFAHDTFSGLSHLEGKTVAILADGNVHPQLVVTGGAVTLQYPAAVVHIGLPYESDFETLEITQPNAESIRDRNKIINRVTLVVDASRGIFAGPGPNQLDEFKQRETEDYLDPVNPLSDIARIPITSQWARSARVFVRQSDPLPITILASIPEMSIGG